MTDAGAIVGGTPGEPGHADHADRRIVEWMGDRADRLDPVPWGVAAA